MHILIIDDDDDTRELLRLILGAEGHHVDEAADGIQALQRLDADSAPAMILLDMMMPRLDGEGVMQAIKGDPRLAAIPIFIMSGHEAARRKARELGASGCLVKPVELDELATLVRDIASSAEARV